MPKAVVLDPTFAVAAIEPSVSGHDAAALFMERMVSADTRVFFNDVLELQLLDAAFELEAPADRTRATRGRSLPVPTRARSLLAHWRSLITWADAVYVELEPLLEDVVYYRERQGVPALRCVHAALVMASGADGIATLDRSYGGIDPSLLPIFTSGALAADVRAVRRSNGWSDLP